MRYSVGYSYNAVGSVLSCEFAMNRTVFYAEYGIIGRKLFWEDVNIQLPNLPLGRKWRIIMNTEFEHTPETDYQALTRWTGIDWLTLCPRSVIIARVEKF